MSLEVETPVTPIEHSVSPSLIQGGDPELPSMAEFISTLSVPEAEEPPARPVGRPKKVVVDVPAVEAAPEPTAVAETTTEEPAKKTKSPEEIAEAYAKAAQENGKIRKARQAEKASFAAKEAALAAKEAELNEWKARVAAAKGDPVKARAILEKDLGVSYEDETRHYIGGKKDPPTAEEKLEALARDLAETKKALAEKEAASEQRAKDRELEIAKAEEARLDKQYESQGIDHVKSNPEKFELLNLYPQEASGVWTIIKAAYYQGIASQGIAQGTKLTFDNAASMLEDYLEKQYRPAATAKKFASVKSVDAETPKAAKSLNPGLSNKKATSPASSPDDDDLNEDRDVAMAKIVQKMNAYEATRKKK